MQDVARGTGSRFRNIPYVYLGQGNLFDLSLVVLDVVKEAVC